MANYRREIPLRVATQRGELWNGDVMLFRGSGAISRLIQRAGQTRYSHAAMVAWWTTHHGESVPMALETREWRGGRAVTVASQVERHAGRIDVYRLRRIVPPPDLGPAVEYMIRSTGSDYGYAAVLAAALRHLPVWRWRVEPDDDDNAIDDRPPFCSQLIDQAYRQSGVDLCPRRAGRITEPGDLAESGLLEFQYTLGGL